MAITYSGANNRFTIAGFSEETPADTDDLVSFDRATDFELLAATALAAGMTLTKQIKPVELLATFPKFTLDSVTFDGDEQIDIYGVNHRHAVLTAAASDSGANCEIPTRETWRFKNAFNAAGGAGTVTIRLIDKSAPANTETHTITSITDEDGSDNGKLVCAGNLTNAYAAGDLVGIDVTENLAVAANQAYYAENEYGAIAYFDCTGFNDGTVKVEQEWIGGLWEHGENQRMYTLDDQIWMSHGHFAMENQALEITNKLATASWGYTGFNCRYDTDSTTRFGTKKDETNEIGDSGCWVHGRTVKNYHWYPFSAPANSGDTIQIYASLFSKSGGYQVQLITEAGHIWQSLFTGFTYWRDVKTDIHMGTTTAILRGPDDTGSYNKLSVLDNWQAAVRLMNASHNIHMTELYSRGCPHGFYFETTLANRAFYMDNCDPGTWSRGNNGGGAGYVHRRLNVIVYVHKDDGTLFGAGEARVTLTDQNSNQIFQATTDANGAVGIATTRWVTLKDYDITDNTGASDVERFPFTLIIDQVTGYDDFVQGGLNFDFSETVNDCGDTEKIMHVKLQKPTSLFNSLKGQQFANLGGGLIMKI